MKKYKKKVIQAVDDEFLEWFIKNPSCEFVNIITSLNTETRKISYEIIIPKEESNTVFITTEQAVGFFGAKKVNKLLNKKEKPKQETLEEVAFQKRKELGLKGTIDGFIAGAKWQAEIMYSEEEVFRLLVHSNERHGKRSVTTQCIKIWFEQFKKK